ncbi:hypothetical protein TNCV_1217721 [Trichonephila clavipes]|nr:hypothetical protein TNCV_1217721 [Trichonephila clavipes]
MHQWYTGTSTGSLQQIKYERGSQTDVARLTRGHQKRLFFNSVRKFHPTCKKCCGHPTSLDHILGYRRHEEEPMDWDDVPFLTEVSAPFVPSRPPTEDEVPHLRTPPFSFS